MYRVMLALLLAAAAAPLAAFFSQPKGYNITEYPQTGGVGGITWDPAGPDFYASHSGGIRRFDTLGGSFAGTALFPAPASIPPAAYAFFDTLAIDPANPDDFYVSYSGNYSRMHKLTRTGPDSSTVTAFLDYATNGDFVYDLVFVPDIASVPSALRGQLIMAASQGFGGPAKLYVVDKTTLQITEIADVGTTNGSAPLAVDSSGNVYTVIPPSFGSFTGAVLLRFAAADLAGAIGGTPLAASQAEVLISAADNEWNINALTARDEGGSTFLYYSTFEHASIFRMCLDTGESREFIHGFGGVADGYSHFAQAGSIAFSSDADDFHPAGGGAVVMAVPFSVFTPGFGSYHSFYLFDPEPVNVAVATLTITQAPAAINSGVPFSITLNALNSGGGALSSFVGVEVTATGGGTLTGFNIVSRPGNALLVDGLVYTGGIGGAVTLTANVAGAPGVSVSTSAIPVVSAAAALAVTSQPGSPRAGRFFSVTLELRDSGGALVSAGPDASREVSVAVSAGPGNLFGELTESGAAGVVVFDALIVDATGTYTLEFTSPGLPAQTLNLSVTSASGSGSTNDDGGGDDGGSCSSGTGNWGALMACLALALAALGLRRATGVAKR